MQITARFKALKDEYVRNPQQVAQYLQSMVAAPAETAPLVLTPQQQQTQATYLAQAAAAAAAARQPNGQPLSAEAQSAHVANAQATITRYFHQQNAYAAAQAAQAAGRAGGYANFNNPAYRAQVAAQQAAAAAKAKKSPAVKRRPDGSVDACELLPLRALRR